MSELLKIDVSGKIEKKAGLSYLSWAWAWSEVLKIDPAATWAVNKFGDNIVPYMKLDDGTCMVEVSATIKGSTKTAVLPVMDNRNKAIKNPDAFSVNKAIMRCLVKAIAYHGLGLSIYAGEDLPEGDPEADLKVMIASIENADTLESLKAHFAAGWKMADANHRTAIKKAYDARTKQLTKEPA